MSPILHLPLWFATLEHTCVCAVTSLHMLACPFASLAAKQLALLSEHRRFPLPEQFVPIFHWETLRKFLGKCVCLFGVYVGMETHSNSSILPTKKLKCLNIAY